MDNKSQFLSNMMGGQQASPAPQTSANLIGGLLLAGGLYGAYKNAKVDVFGKATKDIQVEMDKIIPQFDKRAADAKTGLVAELAGYETRAQAQAKQGLEARGITDRAVGRETSAQVKGGLSGAYAAARAALTGAKMRAGSNLSQAMGQYYQDLAKKQYQSKLASYYDKMGIWGALGGIGASLMSGQKKDGAQVPTRRTEIDTSQFGDYSTQEFRMKGVKDTPPVMLDSRYLPREDK